ncbi:MAG TPA: hypothetical protein QF924_20865 [Pseudomonadales bacterium]|nr:hypothetical protein [Pseudomonadales bacterium]
MNFSTSSGGVYEIFMHADSHSTMGDPDPQVCPTHIGFVVLDQHQQSAQSYAQSRSVVGPELCGALDELWGLEIQLWEDVGRARMTAVGRIEKVKGNALARQKTLLILGSGQNDREGLSR